MTNKNNFSWLNPSAYPKKTNKYGMGVFVKKIIKKGELVAIIGGHVLTIENENALMNNEDVSDKWVEISESFSIGPVKKSEIPGMPHVYINHSCNPNCGFKGQIFIIAMRNIEIEEEITFDYGMIISSNPKSTGYFKMKCLCGSKNCRGIIDEEGWKNPILQKRYKGYFQWYLEEKIKKLNKNKI